MDWLNRMDTSLAYIEEHLADEIDYNEIAKRACCSFYHFQKIFSLMTDIPLSEYIRNRRLSKAAFDLQNTDMRVLDIALKYGYDSPTAFNRAFRKVHGISPNAAKNSEVSLKTYLPISFQISIRGAVMMDYKIKQQKEFQVIGYRFHSTIENDEQMKKIPQFWEECYQNGNFAKLLECCQSDTKEENRQKGIMGICVWNPQDGKPAMDYYIAIASEKEPLPGMVAYKIPETTYAAFECTGPMPTALQDLTKRIISEWLPNSGYEFGSGPDIEIYHEGDTRAADYKSEVWVSVKSK